MIGKEDAYERMSSFTQRGENLRNSFAERFGGGGFVGTSKVAETFKDDAGDMVNKVVETDTKTINNMIASALADKVKEETKKEEPTYTKPNQTTVNAEMSNDQLDEFLSNAIKNEESAKKTNTTKLTEDSGVKNVATALQTTQDSALEGLNYSGLDPGLIRSIMANQKNLQQVEIQQTSYNPTPNQSDATMQPMIMPDLGDINGIDPMVLQSLINAQSQTETQQAQEVQPTPPTVSEKFNDLVDTAFGTDQETPESYKLSSVKATYTKVEKEGGAVNIPTDTIDEDLESIDVIGSVDEPSMEDEIDTIDVVGDGSTEDEIDTIDVVGGEEKRQSLKPEQEEEDSYSFGDNPWERFKALYLDFYTGGRGAEALKDFNRRTLAGEFPGLEGTIQSSKEYENISPVSRDTNDILRMNSERNQISDMMNSMRDNADVKASSPTIINNSRTIVAKAPEDSKTGRVFSDDNTFNRLSAADSNHPQYYGFRI
jgi:ribosomal protein S17E